jgi:hypothetical protein
MSFDREKEIERTIAQSSSSSNTSYLPSNDNKTHDNGLLQSTNMSSNNETKNNKESFSLLIRLKVRFTFFFFCFFFYQK